MTTPVQPGPPVVPTPWRDLVRVLADSAAAGIELVDQPC
jgi:hypothetical protein